MQNTLETSGEDVNREFRFFPRFRSSPLESDDELLLLLSLEEEEDELLSLLEDSFLDFLIFFT